MFDRFTTCVIAAAALLRPLEATAQNAAPASGGWRTPWSYEGEKGPEHWGALDPEYSACNAGHEQSPVDITTTTKAALPALRFSYKNGPVRLINNGYTAVRVNYPPGNQNVLIVGDTRYELTQFHFHHPSEEYVRGKPYAMAAHLMHASSDGKVAGVVVLLRAGAANATVQRLWDHMPQTPGTEHEIAGFGDRSVRIVAARVRLLRVCRVANGAAVHGRRHWIVLKTPVEVSAAEIEAFAKLYPHDVRPLQPLNGRVVKESP